MSNEETKHGVLAVPETFSDRKKFDVYYCPEHNTWWLDDEFSPLTSLNTANGIPVSKYEFVVRVYAETFKTAYARFEEIKAVHKEHQEKS